jgi:hypothetical protein
MSGRSSKEVSSNISLSRFFISYLFLWLVLIIPYGLVLLFPDFFPMIVNLLFAEPFSRLGPVPVLIIAVFAAFGFYWLKLNYQAVYGAIEIFIAQLTICTAVLRLGGPENKTATLLQMFTGIYLTIRGLDNVEKALVDTSKVIWDDYFASDIIGWRILSAILYAGAILAQLYSVVLFAVCFFVVLILDTIVVARIKSRRSPPHAS